MRRERPRGNEHVRRRVEARVRTTMVGSLSAVEDVFGFLWGEGKPWESLTPREREMDRLREELRVLIFDLGNAQIEAVADDLDSYFGGV